VQDCAARVWNEGGSLLAILKADPRVSTKMDDTDLAAIFDLEKHTRHVDTIFARVFDT